ncbi:MAG: thermonuclease family protein [Chryseolinea sp.]
MKAILCFLLVLVAAAAPAATMQGKVTRVIDGNTLEFTSCEGEKYTIVLSGIDCPELTQAFGDEARICLQKLALNKQATVTVKGKDRSGNSIAEVMVDGKKDPRIQLLKDGLAWTEEGTSAAELENYKVASQSKKKGLWKDQNPTSSMDLSSSAIHDDSKE